MKTSSSSDLATFRGERDALAFLGLLSHLYLAWDPPIQAPSGKPGEVTHFQGLNIHALILDNADGEVLALRQNRVNRTNDPIEHAEQLAIRAAVERVSVKRPRASEQTVEKYYETSLFYQEGDGAEDFVRKGCTLYTSLEPCPMCAATLCIARMKRVVYVVPDLAYGGSWDGRGDKLKPGLKPAYYLELSLACEQLAWDKNAARESAVCAAAQQLYAGLLARIEPLRKQEPPVPDTLVFDYLHDDLGAIFAYFQGLRESDLASAPSAGYNTPNAATLRDLKRLCNLPFAPSEIVS